MDVPILGADIIAQTFDGKREERGERKDSERDEEWRLWLKRVREGGREGGREIERLFMAPIIY